MTRCWLASIELRHLKRKELKSATNLDNFLSIESKIEIAKNENRQIIVSLDQIECVAQCSATIFGVSRRELE